MTERDHIGPDPVAWVDRLLDVNADSSFPIDKKAVIEGALGRLRDELANAIFRREG